MKKRPQEPWRSRIVGHGTAAPDQLLANPQNWRVHSKEQEAALDGVLKEVGWVTAVIVNKRTGHLVDGHLRVAAALSRGVESVPVTYVDLSKAEEAKILATLDPLSAMASTDKGKLESLLQEMETGDAGLAGLIASLEKDLGEKPKPAKTKTEHECPKCGHHW